MSLIIRGSLIAKAHCSIMRALGLIVGTMSPTMSIWLNNELIVPFCAPERIMSPPHCCIPLCIQSGTVGQAATAADGRRAQTAGRRYAIAYQTAPPTPPDATTPALLPSRNQRPRCLSALCQQDAACMERRCRLSAAQAEQALGYVHTWHQRLC